MTAIKDLIESLPFCPYSSRKPLGTEMVEVLFSKRILNDQNYDSGSLLPDNFRNTAYGLIFEVWLTLKNQDLPRGIEEVSAQLRQHDLIGKNGLEMVGEAFLIFLKNCPDDHDARDTIIQDSIIRKLQAQVWEENINQNLGEVLEALAHVVKEIP